ncbi:MAG: hypothetical protein JW909_03410 [Planctomycetes bacterium]|nr:hypothetical protein [Planctomycetota bacterium]
MAIYDDTFLADDPGGIELVNPAGRRRITHAVHDIDGTHSLIRDWPPVMALSIHWAMTGGLDEDFDSEDNLKALIDRVGKEELEEAYRFSITSAGLSAITQMEYGIRRAVELGNIPAGAGLELSQEDLRNNAAIIRRMWEGEERFDDVAEPQALTAFINERTPRLFRLYEAVLNGACRDRNTAAAWKSPEDWRVPGSMEFMAHLHDCGVENFFVTGAVVYEDGGMYEEVKALGFEIGPGKMVVSLEGSSWDTKLPKGEVMERLFSTRGIDPACAVVLGDGRTEIKAGVEMGCVTVSRLDRDAGVQRQLHRGFGTNLVVEDFSDPRLWRLIEKE